MHRQDTANLIFLDYLNDQERLRFRLVNKSSCDLVRRRQSAPYRTRAQFICALTGIFLFDLSDLTRPNPDTSLSLTLNIFNKWVYEFRVNANSFSLINKQVNRALENLALTDSWKLYLQTLRSTSSQPAMLYKLKHRHLILGSSTHEKFRSNENMVTTTRMYAPSKHTWAENQAWVLAQIHKGRRFVLFSPVRADTVFRQPDRRPGQQQFSAFALEIAAIIKAGYEVSLNQYHRVELSPKPGVNLLAVTYHDLTVTEYEVMNALGQIQAMMTTQSDKTLSQSPPSI